MKKYNWLIVGVFVASGCGEVVPVDKPKSCEVSCTTTADCPSGLTCDGLGLCAADGEACSCTAGEFVSCDNGNALFCNAEANGIRNETCGAPGCNDTAKRCNTCVVDTISCSANATTLDHCGADGVVAQSDTCTGGCVTDAAGDHCGHIAPAWLPDVCDEPATTAQAVLGSTLNTQDDAACTGGVLDINGTTFCVVRAGTIDIPDLKVTGTRAIAFVADDQLTVSGVLDVSADGATPGPGAGTRGAGAATTGSSVVGGGGSGFAQTGGTGGGNESGGGGMAGGAVTTRLTTDPFVGGATAPFARCGSGNIGCFNAIDFAGGGGGGGALLIACRGTVSVTGTVDAGGGGGTGGGDHFTGTAISQGGAPGGGSGGFVVFQGLQVEITGNLYANGGGGGAGCGVDNCRGPVGGDGLRGTTGALGGDPAGNACGGGIGGSASSVPGPGEVTFSNAAAGAGGGGGSMGRFAVFTPMGVAPILTPAQASPAPAAGAIDLAVE